MVEASGSVPAGSENEVPDDVADVDAETAREMQWDEDMDMDMYMEGREAEHTEGEEGEEGDDAAEELTDAELDALIGPEDEVVPLAGLTEEQLAATPLTAIAVPAVLDQSSTRGGTPPAANWI